MVKTKPNLIHSFLLLAVLLTLPAVVQAQYNYTTTNGTITITGYTGSGGAVTIPSTTNGLPVTSIGSYAFQNCTSLTSVTIPNSVTSIGESAFDACTSLSSVTIPNSVTSIGSRAFYSCTSLSSVTIPNSVTNIRDYAFQYCTSLTSATIPNSVTSIGYWAFGICNNLTNVTIGNGVTNIGSSAFSACTSLSAITVDALNSVYSSVDGVLFNKSQTTLIQCPGGKAGTYTIPTSVTSIGDRAFDSCHSLTSVTIGNSVTSIGDSAFCWCTSLTSVTIPDSVTSIGSDTFYYCTSLTSVTIPDSVTSIGSGAFYGCSSLTSVTIPNSVTSIGDYAFYDCGSLTGVYFQGNAPSLGSAVFSGDNVKVYYLPGTTGWGLTFGGRLTYTILTIPAITITGSFPPGPVTNGASVVFGGLVCNSGNITLTNIFVFSGQPSNTLVLGPLTLAPEACAPFTGSFLATGGSNPTTNSTITTNTVIPTFGTINPVSEALTNRFNVVSNLHGLMFADQDENWGPTLFYSTGHPVSGADQFDTISTIPPFVGVVTNRYNLLYTNYDALTLAAPDVGYGEINFYYIRHDNLGVSTFGQIISQGASSSADLWVIPKTGYTGLAFAAANVGYGANMFYYVRNDTNGLSWFGTIDPTPGGAATDLYPVGTNFDALVYVDLAPIPGWGTDFFAYLRHDNTGSIIGTIDPVTHVATNRVHLGTNFLTGLTFTATDVGYGPNLFYYLRPERSTYTTNSVVSFTPTNTITATGMDIYQARTVIAATNCIESVAPAPLVPVIGAPTMVNGIFSLSFPTEPGKSYTVQYKNNLSDPTWTDLETVVGTGGNLNINDPTPAGLPSRFYRIKSP